MLKNNAVPLYEQVADSIRKEITSGKIPAGENIGTHLELTKKYGVSLITVRKALKILTDEGMIILKQGKGTFVNRTVFQDDSNSLTGLSVVLEKNAVNAQVEVRNMSFTEPPESLPQKIRESLGKSCLYIERVHVLNSSALSYARIWLPEKYGAFVSREDIMQNTVYRIYEKKFNVELGKGVQTIYSKRAGKEVSRIMGCGINDPVMSVKREAYAKSGSLIEYMEAFYDASRYSFKVEMKLSAD